MHSIHMYLPRCLLALAVLSTFCPVLFGQTKAEKVLFIGNSITKHGPKADIDWAANWGMAASAEDKDYVHLVSAALAGRSGIKPEVMVKNIADFERAYASYDLPTGIEDAVRFRADLIILSIGENVPTLKTADDRTNLQESITRLLAMLKGERKATVLVRSCFWPNQAKDEVLRRACNAVGAIFVNISSLSEDPKNFARSEREYKHAGVANHPGDRGMAAIADAILSKTP